MRYNGWHNRATWNAALWLFNDEPLYRRALGICRHARTLGDAAASLRVECASIWPDGATPDGHPLRSIPIAGWREIARSFRDD